MWSWESYSGPYEYNRVRKERNRAQDSSNDYREKYLELRKTMREYFKANPNAVLPDDIKKMIGAK